MFTATQSVDQIIFEWDKLEKELQRDLAAEELKAAQPKHIPNRCEYNTRRRIKGAPTPSMDPITAGNHPDLLAKAEREIRSYVCRNYRAWPACPVANRNVELAFDYGYDADQGEVLIGMFHCRECR